LHQHSQQDKMRFIERSPSSAIIRDAGLRDAEAISMVVSDRVPMSSSSSTVAISTGSPGSDLSLNASRMLSRSWG
jgi:hypothetical protein